MFKALKEWWDAPVELKPFAVSEFYHLTLEDCEELWAIHEMPTSPSDKTLGTVGGDGTIATGRGDVGDRYYPNEAQATRYRIWEAKHVARIERTEKLAASFVATLQAQDAMEKAIEAMK